MARTDKKAIIRLCNEINKKKGAGSLYTLDSKYANLKINRWSTGIEDLDAIIGGGMPEGRTVEIYGPESAGKTSLMYHLFAQHELALDLPVEGCVDCDTEFFNGKGWKKISEYEKGEKVLQYNADGTATLEYPKKYHCLDTPLLWHVFSKRLDMVVSEHHNVVYKTTSKKPKLMTKQWCEVRDAIDWNEGGFCGNVPKTFDYSGPGVRLSENIIRLMVAIFADGSFPNTNTKQCYVGLSKQRKIKRFKMLLNNCGIPYRIKNNFFIFYAPVRCKHYPKFWYKMNNEQFLIVVDEMKHWDGCQYEKGHVPSFCTTCKSDADFIQFAYTSIGYPAYITVRDRRDEPKFIKDHWVKSEKIAYVVCSGVHSKIVSLRKAKYEPYVPIDGKMYCFTMNSGMWVMRRKDKIIVTGNTFDSSRAKVFGNRKKQLLVYRATYGEDAFNKIIQFSKSGIPIIGVDSVPSLIPRDDVEKVEKGANRGSVEEQRIGGTARLMTKYLPMVENVIEITGTTVIFINQVRDKMNAMLFGEKTDTPGGHKLKHSASLRIQVARKAWIEISNKDPRNSAEKERIGMIMKCKVVKSKVCNPMGECEIPLFFERGFVSFAELEAVRKEIMLENKERYGKLYGR